MAQALHNVADFFEVAGGHAFPDDLAVFAEEYIRPDGNQWSWERREYLRGWLVDDAARKVARKAAQVGATTAATVEAIWRAVNDWKIGVFLPGKRSMNKYVQTQFDPLINRSKALRKAVVLAGELQKGQADEADDYERDKSADSLETKHIGEAGVFNLMALGGGLECVKQLPMDLTNLDEVSEAARIKDPELGMSLVEFIPDRLMASRFGGREREFSQPGVEGMDIDASFQQSDQRYWMLGCDGCGHKFNPETEWPNGLRYRLDGPQIRLLSADEMAERYSVDLPGGTWEQHCPNGKCEKSHEFRLLPGEWVARHPGRAVHGYQFSQLWGPEMTPGRLGDRWMRAQSSFSAKGAFIISVLGFPFSGDRKPITAASLGYGNHGYVKAPTDDPPSLYYVGGVDTAKGMHYVVYGVGHDGRKRIVWAGHTEDEREVAHVMGTFGARFGVDSMPERRTAKDMCLAVGSGAIVIIGGGGRRTTIGTEKRGREDVPTIGVDRTELLDAVVDSLEDHTFMLGEKTDPLTAQVVEHLCMAIKDKQPDGTHLYRESSGCENHWLMALAMANLVDENQATLRLGRTEQVGTAVRLGPADRLTAQPAWDTGASKPGVTEMSQQRQYQSDLRARYAELP